MPPGDPRTPYDLGPYQVLKTPTTAPTDHRRGLLAFLNHAPPIAALSGEKKARLSADKLHSTNAMPRGALPRRGLLALLNHTPPIAALRGAALLRLPPPPLFTIFCALPLALCGHIW